MNILGLNVWRNVLWLERASPFSPCENPYNETIPISPFSICTGSSRVPFEVRINTIIIRECTHDDIEAIFRLDQDWETEGVSYIFTHGYREGFIADFERFQEYYFVAEHDGQVIGYINGSGRVNENQTDILPD